MMAGGTAYDLPLSSRQTGTSNAWQPKAHLYLKDEIDHIPHTAPWISAVLEVPVLRVGGCRGPPRRETHNYVT